MYRARDQANYRERKAVEWRKAQGPAGRCVEQIKGLLPAPIV